VPVMVRRPPWGLGPTDDRIVPYCIVQYSENVAGF
jgi:hypothetical protein